MFTRRAAPVRRAVGATLALAGVLGAGHRAGAVPVGPELRVNTTTAGPQLDPAIAVDHGGASVVVWTSTGQDGSGTSVHAQRHDAAGSPVGPEVRVNTFTADDQSAPAVAIDADGDFVVVWQSATQDGWLWGVYGQRFAANGEKVGREFRVNSRTAREQVAPAVAMDDAGRFVVAWASYGQDGSAYGVYAQRYAADGTPLGAEFQVNSFVTGDQNAPDVAMDGDGDFAIAFQGYTQGPGTGSNTYVRRYAASGVAAGDAALVNTYTAGDQGVPSVAMDADGDAVVVWRSAGQDGSSGGIFGQWFDALGARVGGERQVNTTTAGDQTHPSVDVGADGDAVVTWASDDGSSSGVWSQRFDAGGVRDVDGEVRVNTTTAASQTAPSVAVADTGDHLVTWQSDAQDGSGFGVFVQRFGGRPEVCDGVDNDRDGVVDDGVTTTFYADADGDGFGDADRAVEACDAPDGFVDRAGDALDGDDTVYPDAPELCDGKDNDQDGAVDDGWPDADGDAMVDCVDPDDDNDGIEDERDPDVVAGIITSLPRSALATGGAGSAMLTRLDAVERQLLSGSAPSVNQLEAMRTWMDGCDGSSSETSDNNDKVLDCAAQHDTRAALDALIANLSS